MLRRRGAGAHRACNLESAICQTTGTDSADGAVILTPVARDEPARRGTRLAFGPKPEAVTHCAAHQPGGARPVRGKETAPPPLHQ